MSMTHSAVIDRRADERAGPLRIMHITAPAPVGGLERVVHGLAVGHHAAGIPVCVVAVVDEGAPPHPFVLALEADGVHVEVIETSRRGYLSERRRVRAIMNRFRPDVVHMHAYRPVLLHAGNVRRFGSARVATVHGSSRMGGVTNMYEWVEDRIMRRFEAVIAVSDQLGVALEALGMPRRALHVIPNAWSGGAPLLSRAEARRRLGLPQNEFVIGWVGRQIRAKGPDVFLRSLDELRRDDWHASLIGDGPERNAVHGLAASLDSAERVHLHGLVNPAGAYYAAFDVFVLSSRTEGTPIALLEAMFARVPIVATAVGGVPETVTSQEAILVPKEDPAALARAIEDVRNDPDAAAARAAAACARLAARHDPALWLDSHLEVYRQAVQRLPR
jgi:glycosyltransferase involved in cell wall biosynthesis